MFNQQQTSTNIPEIAKENTPEHHHVTMSTSSNPSPITQPLAGSPFLSTNWTWKHAMAGGSWWAPYPINGKVKYVKSGEPLKEWNRENLTNDTDKKLLMEDF